MQRHIVVAWFFQDTMYKFLEEGGLFYYTPENIPQPPELGNSSVGKKETTGTPVTPGVLFLPELFNNTDN